MSLRGTIDAIPLEAVLQLLADTGKTGQLAIDSDQRHGALAVSDGKLVSARSADETGPAALGEIFTIQSGRFEFRPADRIDERDLSGDLDELLDRAVAERDRIAAVRALIPDERMRFTLSARAAESAEIRLSADEWRALLAVDGQRDVAAIADRLGIRRLAALDLLAGLVTAGMVDATPPPDAGTEPPIGPGPVARTASGEAVVLSGTTTDFPLETIVQLLAHTKQTGRVEVRSEYGLSTLGLAGGQLVSARADEEAGDLALGATFAIDLADFQFIPTTDVPAADLTGDLDELLDRAAETRQRIAAIRALVPNERARFALSERAAQHAEIRLRAEEWRALLAVNGERDVAGIAEQLRMRRLPTMVILADLIEGGLVDVLAPPPEPAPPPFLPAETVVAEAAPAAEEPLAETPVDVPPAGADDRLSAITGVVGPAQTVPPPETWPAAAPITEIPPPPSPTWWETPGALAQPAEQPAETTPSWEQPAEETPSAEEYVDPRLAAFGTPAAEPAAEVPTWTAPATEAVVTPSATETPAWPPVEERPASELVVDLEAEPLVGVPPVEAPTVAEEVAPITAAPPAPVAAPKRGLFGGMFGGGKQPAAATAPPPAASQARTRAGQLALFVNELLASYNSGRYGKGRIEDRMVNLLMRVDEQADPVDRPLPVKINKLDVGSIDGAAVPERQALPYLATLTRQVYDDAERALGKDKAKRGFRDTRERLFGKDLSLFQTPEIAQRVPRV